MIRKDFSAYRGGTPKEDATAAPKEASSRRKPRYGAYKTNTKKKLAALALTFGLAAGGWYLYSDMTAPRLSGPTYTDTTEHTNFFADSATLLKRTQAVTANTSFFDSHFLRAIDGSQPTTMNELKTLAHALNRDDAFNTFKTSFDGIYRNPNFGGTGALSALPLPEQLAVGSQLRTAIDTFTREIRGENESDPTKRTAALQAYEQQLGARPNAAKLFRGMWPTQKNYEIAGGDTRGEVKPTEQFENKGAPIPARGATPTTLHP